MDLDWSPDGSVLAIVGGVEAVNVELHDPRIHLHELSTGRLRTLDDTLGGGGVSWSPDGARMRLSARQPPGDRRGDR